MLIGVKEPEIDGEVHGFALYVPMAQTLTHLIAFIRNDSESKNYCPKFHRHLMVICCH